jgi:hypothetical protein
MTDHVFAHVARELTSEPLNLQVESLADKMVALDLTDDSEKELIEVILIIILINPTATATKVIH